MPGADPSSEVEVVQLSSLNDDSVAFDAGGSHHNSTGNKTNASGPSQSRYVSFEQLITESSILPFKLAQAQPSQQTPMPRSEISGNDQDITYPCGRNTEVRWGRHVFSCSDTTLSKNFRPSIHQYEGRAKSSVTNRFSNFPKFYSMLHCT